MLIMSGTVLKVIPPKTAGKSKTVRILCEDQIYGVSCPEALAAEPGTIIEIPVMLKEYQGRSFFVYAED